MGNQKLKWTSEEEEALKAGVAKYGAGKWKNILVDSDFKHKLSNRSNVDLKDKWRNMGGQGSGANSVNSRAKSITNGALIHKAQSSDLTLVPIDNVIEKPPQSPEGVRNSKKYNEMILEALSSIKDRNGPDFVSVLRFIEKKYEVPQNFRRLLSVKLRKFILQGTVEKVQNRYKIKHAPLGTKTPLPKQKVARSKPRRDTRSNISTEMEDAAKIAAQKIAEAENEEFLAAEAVKESERLSQLAEEADAVVLHLKQRIEQCKRKEATQTPKLFCFACDGAKFSVCRDWNELHEYIG
ncbi:telomere repeat-binding factor 4-like isoform X2 [Salvia hispanica]|uniref:telomere repeat-binding factor 4-like isoform X2 n=1 Tax=Salvia hispanica TaxID=49212 RepID=UPI0020097AB9|nr:telomere repeat-binding factor 4-like isoform X2 [Salvia hispanica]